MTVAACGVPKPITLPTDQGSPLPDFAAVHARLSTACAGVRTLTTEIGLSGRAGKDRLGGRVLAGFERPSSMLLTGVAPFGPPVFILAARDGSATFLLPREERVIRNAPPEAILDALAGVALGPSDLLAVFTGCVLPAPRATAGRTHAGGWASIDVESGEQLGTPRRTATVFLQRARSQWQLRAARRDQWQIEYVQESGLFPQSVRLIASSPPVNLTAALSQIETNRDLDPAAFTVAEPKGVTSLTVEELREAGPLRGQ